MMLLGRPLANATMFFLFLEQLFWGMCTDPQLCGPECGSALSDLPHSDSCSWNPPGWPGVRRPGYWDIQPHFHISDSCNDENDPCSPFYFNGMYHVMYQSRTQFHHWNASWSHSCDHAAGPKEPGKCGAGDVGISLGHAVSKDLVHWQEVQQAIWPDRWYTSVSVYDGSATVVDGVPTIIFGGLTPNSTSPFCHVRAIPKNLSDPFLLDWVVPDDKPLYCGTPDGPFDPRDSPTSAWKTSFGEWRFVDSKGSLYYSRDFQNWSVASEKFTSGICQDFYELPRVCDGCIVATGSNTTILQPTHVHSGAREWKLYAYSEGAAGTTGSLTETHFATIAESGSLGCDSLSDHGGFYVPKSFFDPVKKRRVMYGWNQPVGVKGVGGRYKGSTQSLLREVTYDPRLGMLYFHPVEEYVQLRNQVLAKLSKPVSIRKVMALSTPANLANQSEVRVRFKIPTVAVRFGVRVMTGTCKGGTHDLCTAGARFGTEFFIDYKPPPLPAAAAWVVTVGSNRSTVPPQNGWATPQSGAMALLRSEKEIELLVYVDQTVCEAFFAGGRFAMVTQVPAGGLLPGIMGKNAEQGVELFASVPGVVEVNAATVWQMGNIWNDVRTHDRDAELSGGLPVLSEAVRSDGAQLPEAVYI